MFFLPFGCVPVLINYNRLLYLIDPMMTVLVTNTGEWVSARILFLKIPTAFLGSPEIAYLCLQRLGYGSESDTDKRKKM